MLSKVMHFTGRSELRKEHIRGGLSGYFLKLLHSVTKIESKADESCSKFDDRVKMFSISDNEVVGISQVTICD